MRSKVWDNFDNEYRKDNICDECGIEMKETKLPRRKYGKENSYYECDICGNKVRKRTANEVARDCGIIE